MKFGFIVRSYAPFPTFGIPSHHGDNRNASTASSATSRLKAWVAFDPIAGIVETPHAKSDTSTIYLGWLGDYSKTGVPEIRIDSVQLGKAWLHFRLHAAGKNPLIAVAADIDMHAAVTVSIDKGNLNITGELTGDQFPNYEVMLQDEGATRRMVMTYETGHGRRLGPEKDLWSDKKKPMNAICKSFPIDKHGRFV